MTRESQYYNALIKYFSTILGLPNVNLNHSHSTTKCMETLPSLILSTKSTTQNNLLFNETIDRQTQHSNKSTRCYRNWRRGKIKCQIEERNRKESSHKQKIKLERLIRSLPLQFVVQVGQLVNESVIGMNVPIHSHRPNRLLGSHLSRNHEVGQNQRSGPGNSDQAMHQHSASAVHAVLNELGSYVEVPRNVRGRRVRQREAHVTEERRKVD